MENIKPYRSTSLRNKSGGARSTLKIIYAHTHFKSVRRVHTLKSLKAKLFVICPLETRVY